MTTFSRNPGTSLLVADIAMQLQQITHDSIIGQAIRESASVRPVECVRMIKDQIKDNNNIMDDIIGWRLVDKIKKL